MIALLKEKLYNKGFFHLLSTNFLIQFLGFGSTLAVAKMVSPEELGVIKLLQSYTGVFAVVAGFGLSTALLKYCSEARNEEEKAGILSASMRRAMIASFLTVAAGAALALGGIITAGGKTGIWLAIYSLIVPFSVATNLLITYLQSQRRLHSLAKAQILIRIQSFLAVVFCTWFWGFTGFVIATLASYAVGLIPLARQVRISVFPVSAGRVPPGFARIAAFTLVAGLVSTAGQYADIFILDRFAADRRQLGYYALATVFIMAASQVINTIQQFLSPYFCQRNADISWFRRNVLKAQAFTSILSLALAGAVFALAWVMVRFVFGGEYTPTLSYLSVLLLRFVIWSGYAVTGGVAVFALGKVGLDFVRSLVSMVVGTACSFALLQRYGIIGAAWGQVYGALAAFLLSLIMARMLLWPRGKMEPVWSAGLKGGEARP